MFDMYKQMNEIDDNASLISKKPVVKSRKLVESVNHKLRIVEGYSVKHGRGKPAVEFDSLDAAVQHINDGMSKKAEDSYILYNDGKEMIWLDWYSASRDGENNAYTVSRQNDKSVELKDGKLVAKTTLKEADEDEAPAEASANGGNGEAVADKLANAADYETFVNILNSDGKSQAFLKFLSDHYKMGDDAIGTIKKCNPSETKMKCGDLQPTQQNISVSKSLDMIAKGGWSETIINNPTNAFTTPTVTYAGKYIIDGHHRWSRIVALNGPESELKVLNFPAISGVNWSDMLKAVELAIVATNPNAKLIQSVGNDNMLSPEGAKLAMQYYAKNACDEVVEAMKAKGRGDSKEAQAQTVGKNVLETIKTSKPVAGAAKRDFMPQMDDAGKAKEKLIKDGVVDMTESVDTMSESTGRVTLEVMFEKYIRYGDGGIHTAKISGKDEVDALIRMCDKMRLYIDSDWAEEFKEETGSYLTVENIIENISMNNGDGCDYIFYIKNLTSGETLLDEGGADAEDWDDDVTELEERYFDDEVGAGSDRNTPYSTQRGVGVWKNETPDWWKKSGRNDSDWNKAKSSSINSWDEDDRYNR